MDIEKLIKRLKCPKIQSCPMNGEDISCKACQMSIEQEVITAFSTLQAENEKLRDELEQVREKNAGLALALLTECASNPDCLGSDEWRVIKAELEQLKQCIEIVEHQRNEAIKELENYMVQDVLDGNEPCGICAKASDIPCEYCNPKWRGPKED